VNKTSSSAAQIAKCLLCMLIHVR